MIRVGPTFKTYGTRWDHQGKTDIAKIIISCSSRYVNAMHFVYVEDGRHVLSERIGAEGSSTIKTISFDCPSEYITRISGKYVYTSYLLSITFYTNKKTYGPFVPNKPAEPFSSPQEFDYETGGNKFYGFFGTYGIDHIESIGFYMKPVQTLANPLRLPNPNPHSYR